MDRQGSRVGFGGWITVNAAHLRAIRLDLTESAAKRAQNGEETELLTAAAAPLMSCATVSHRRSTLNPPPRRLVCPLL